MNVIMYFFLIQIGLITTAMGFAQEGQNEKPFLTDGWYAYDFVREMEGIESEYQFRQQTGGMEMIQKTTLNQKGTVISCKSNSFLDPSLKIILNVDATGGLSCDSNPTISGTLDKKGAFQWSGSIDNGQLWQISVSGTITPITEKMRAGPGFNGLWHMCDTSGQGREMLVRIQDGFYTWNYLTYEEGDELFEPWPTRIAPDGAFSSEMEMTTVLDMAGITQANYSTTYTMEGNVTPGEGISLQELTSTAGTGESTAKENPAVYSGVNVYTGEFPNEQIPSSAAILLAEKVETAQNTVSAHPDNSPDWYRSPPKKTGYLIAVGEKTFPDKATALALAEAVAAADLAARIRTEVKSTHLVHETASSDGSKTSLETLFSGQSALDIPYTVVHSDYNTETGTAWILVELSKDRISEILAQ